MTILCKILRNGIFYAAESKSCCYEQSIEKMCDVGDVRGIFFCLRDAALKNDYNCLAFCFGLVFSPNVFD